MEVSQLLNSGMLADINISFLSTLYALLASIISATLVRKAYVLYGRSMNNREYFGNIFILLAVTTCTVIIIVKYSLALSLGLVGALSIVRFRAAIKEPEELVYLFLTIAFGLAFGASQFAIGFLLLGISLAIIYVSDIAYNRTTENSHTGMICVISGDREAVVEFKNLDLKKAVDFSRTTILKEISLEDNRGRLVLRITSNESGEELTKELERMVSSKGLNFNLVSEIAVAG